MKFINIYFKTKEAALAIKIDEKNHKHDDNEGSNKNNNVDIELKPMTEDQIRDTALASAEANRNKVMTYLLMKLSTAKSRSAAFHVFSTCFY